MNELSRPGRIRVIGSAPGNVAWRFAHEGKESDSFTDWPGISAETLHDYPAVSDLGAQAFEGLFGMLTLRVADLTSQIESLTQRLREVEESLEEVSLRPRERIIELPELMSDRYALRRPILVNIEEYDDEALARWPVIELTAQGVTESEALNSLCRSLIELYEELVEDEDNLGETPLRWLTVLNGVVIEKRNGEQAQL
jgi:hypothetical protein